MSLDRLSQIHNRKCSYIRATWTQVFVSTETFASFDPPLPPSPPPPSRPLCTLHLRILVCGSFSFTFALNIFHYGQESLWSKYWIGIRWLLSLRVNSQNTPYVGLCDCSQQTELRQRDTPRLFQSMLLKQHSPIKHKQLVGQVVPTALKHKKL